MNTDDAFFSGEMPFYYVEELPTEYREDLWQYRLRQHVFTTFDWEADKTVDNLYQLPDGRVVQLN